MLAITLLVLTGPTQLVLDGLDPLILVTGKQTLGRPDLSANYLRHEYRFASEANLRKFKANPARYAVQAGGACGKMGALTGKGSPSRFAVARGQIFLFASDSCRETFLANEANYFGKPMPNSKPTQAQLRMGKDMMARVAQAHGGAAAINRVKSFNWTVETPYEVAGVKKTWVERWGWMGPGTAFSSNEWDAGQNWFAKTTRASSEGDAMGRYAMHPAEARELDAQILRNPLGFLVNANSFSICDNESGCLVRRGDIQFQLLLDDAGRISDVKYFDRHSGPFAEVSVNYSDYKKVGSLQLPMRITTSVNGTLGKPRAIAKWEVNGPKPTVWQSAWAKS